MMETLEREIRVRYRSKKLSNRMAQKVGNKLAMLLTNKNFTSKILYFQISTISTSHLTIVGNLILSRIGTSLLLIINADSRFFTREKIFLKIQIN